MADERPAFVAARRGAGQARAIRAVVAADPHLGLERDL